MNGDRLIQVSVYLVDPTRRPGLKKGTGLEIRHGLESFFIRRLYFHKHGFRGLKKPEVLSVKSQVFHFFTIKVIRG